mgnify:CR=1 FL=1
MGQATQLLKLTYCEGNLIKLQKETYEEPFTCQFEFETEHRLKIIGYEDCNGEYFDKDMTGEFIYPTLDYHFDKMFATCLDSQKIVITNRTTPEDHFKHLDEVAKYQEKSSSWKNPLLFDDDLKRLKERLLNKVVYLQKT